MDLSFCLPCLFDPQKIPTIHLGSVAIPGPLLPLVISVTFIHRKSTRYRARQNRQVEIGRPIPIPNREEAQWPDLRHPDAARFYAAKAIFVFHTIITTGATMQFGQSFLKLKTLCCCEAAALLMYGEFVKPEVRRSCLAAATGWALFSFVEQLPGEVATAVALSAALLAASLAWQIDSARGDMDLQQSGCGLLLMLMVANRIAFVSPTATQLWARQHPAGVTICITIVHAFNGLMVYLFNLNGETRQRDATWDLEATLTTIKKILFMILNVACLFVALLSPLVGGIICTAYLSSCLPFGFILFGKSASTPSLTPYSIAAGALIYIAMWITFGLGRRPPSGPRDKTPAKVFYFELEFCANALGWACTCLNILWVTLGMLA